MGEGTPAAPRVGGRRGGVGGEGRGRGGDKNGERRGRGEGNEFDQTVPVAERGRPMEVRRTAEL